MSEGACKKIILIMPNNSFYEIFLGYFFEKLVLSIKCARLIFLHA